MNDVSKSCDLVKDRKCQKIRMSHVTMESHFNTVLNELLPIARRHLEGFPMQGKWVLKELIFCKMIATSRCASNVFALFLTVYGMHSVLNIDFNIDTLQVLPTQRAAGRRGMYS